MNDAAAAADSRRSQPGVTRLHTGGRVNEANVHVPQRHPVRRTNPCARGEAEDGAVALRDIVVADVGHRSIGRERARPETARARAEAERRRARAVMRMSVDQTRVHEDSKGTEEINQHTLSKIQRQDTFWKF
ncbi:unnamed protein product [Knipowitschia caucasica]